MLCPRSYYPFGKAIVKRYINVCRETVDIIDFSDEEIHIILQCPGDNCCGKRYRAVVHWLDFEEIEEEPKAPYPYNEEDRE